MQKLNTPTPIEDYTAFFCRNVKWLIRDDAPSSVTEKLVPDLSSSQFFFQNVPIKKGKRKSNWIFPVPGSREDEAFIIKRYPSDNLFGRLKNMIRSSKAFRELRMANLIFRRDIPTITPIAIGEKSGWCLIKDSYVVIEKLQNCRDLNSYFLKEYPTQKSPRSIQEKRKIIRELGRLTRDIHQKGIMQSDFALNNFLLTKETRGDIKLYLSDFEKITTRRALSFDQKIKCLTKLNRVGREINNQDRLRFLKSYLGEDGSKKQVSSLAKIIQKRTIALLKQDALRGRITSVYTDALYEKYEQKEMKGYYRRGYKIEDILDVIQKFDPLNENQPFSHNMGHEKEVRLALPYDGKIQSLKLLRYAHLSKASPARTLWTNMSTLSLAGIPLVIPHIFMEINRKGDREGCLFTPVQETEISLGEFLRTPLEKEEVLSLIDWLRKLMKKLHRFGTFSGKISEGNFSVVEKRGGKPALYLRDCRGFRIKKGISARERRKDLALLTDLIKKE